MNFANQRNIFRIDPRTKVILVAIINCISFGSSKPPIMFSFAFIPFILLFLSQKRLFAICYGVVYCSTMLMNLWVAPSATGVINIFVVMLVGLFYRMMPGLVMSYYLIATTTVSEFVSSMERIHIPKQIIIPFSVMFRFFPTINEESSAIKDAMRMRGIVIGGQKFKQNPFSLLEYRMVPLLMSTVKIGDELSAASLTRGLGSSVKRTNICTIGFTFLDVFVLLIGIGALTAYIML